MRQSDDPRDQVIIQLNERVSAIETSLRKDSSLSSPVTRIALDSLREFFAGMVEKQLPLTEIERSISATAQQLGIEATVTTMSGRPVLAITNRGHVHYYSGQVEEVAPEDFQRWFRQQTEARRAAIKSEK
jgi:hypothetical protein